MSETVIETAYGWIAGTHADGVHTFVGVPYGGPVSGRGRYLPPPPPTPWTGVREATRYGPPAVQRPTRRGGDRVGHLYGGGPDVAMDEECLVLNVWTPGLDGRRPVLVWLHGGGFTQGSAGDDVYRGANLAREQDVVVVSLNHRLGIFGFLDLDSVLGPGYAASGTAGLRDIVAALEWVRDHAGALGGDPGCVTLFGESGGGGKIAALLAMPRAAGLFHRAVIQSGPPFQFPDRERAAGVAAKVMAHLDIPAADAGRLLEVPAAALFEAQAALGAGGGPSEGGMSFAPVVGTDDLPRYPEQAVATGMSADVPLLIGTNRDEARFMLMMLGPGGAAKLPALADDELIDRLRVGCDNGVEDLVAHYRAAYPELSNVDLLFRIESEQFRIRSLRLAEAKAAGGPAPVFVYLLTWVWPERAEYGAFHGLEIPLVFANRHVARSLARSPVADRLSRRLGALWSSFAATGAPEMVDGVLWPPFTAEDRLTLLIDEDLVVDDDPLGDDRRAWDGVGTGPATRPWARVLA
jgi:para-nitrobenzyl esterase